MFSLPPPLQAAHKLLVGSKLTFLAAAQDPA